jgi:hypothetical protein
VVFVHQLDAVQSARQRFSVAGSNRSLAGHREHVIGDLPATLMLSDKNIDIGRRRPAGLLDRRKNVRLFELFLVIVLAKAAEQQRRAAERVRINVGSITALSDALSVVGGAGSGACGSGRWRRSGYGIDEVAFGVRFLKNGDRFT